MTTLLHAVAGYFFMVLVVRVLARRAGGQLALFEFVIIFLIGGVSILATVGNDRSVTNCTCAVIGVGLLHRCFSWLKSRYPSFGILIDGTPLVILKHGVWQEEVMKKSRINVAEVLAAARVKGIASLNDVAYAVLERNGSISILEKSK